MWNKGGKNFLCLFVCLLRCCGYSTVTFLPYILLFLYFIDQSTHFFIAFCFFYLSLNFSMKKINIFHKSTKLLFCGVFLIFVYCLTYLESEGVDINLLSQLRYLFDSYLGLGQNVNIFVFTCLSEIKQNVLLHIFWMQVNKIILN